MQPRRWQVWHCGLLRLTLVLTLALSLSCAHAVAAADGGAPAPAHESPKSPHGAEGTTAMIGLICVVLVAAGIAWGSAVDRRATCDAPHAAPTTYGEEGDPHAGA